MASKIECPKCGGASNSFVHGVCRACFMRDHHQRRSASAATECPRCGTVTANFVHGVCRACFMRDYHQRRSASLVTDGEGRRLCAECREPSIYARGLCLSCYMRDRRHRNRMKLHTCTICGVSFQAARRDALYCSMSCRQRAHRVRNASSTSATMTSSAPCVTAIAAAKVSAAVMRGLYRPRRLLSVYRPVAASQVVPATRRRS
jgi:NMD protein affecting ribosome stability and mRNA decay